MNDDLAKKIWWVSLRLSKQFQTEPAHGASVVLRVGVLANVLRQRRDAHVGKEERRWVGIDLIVAVGVPLAPRPEQVPSLFYYDCVQIKTSSFSPGP